MICWHCTWKLNFLSYSVEHPILKLPKIFVMKRFCILSNTFSASIEIIIFILCFINVVWQTYWFAYPELFPLGTGDWFFFWSVVRFDKLGIYIYICFKDFGMSLHHGCWSIVLFICCLFWVLDFKVMLASYKAFVKICFLLVVLNSLRRVGFSSLEVR